MAMPSDFSEFERVETVTLRARAYEQIREALMTGRFEPGQRMTIRGLAEVFGVSPTPVREAVHRLAAEGALEADPNRQIRIPLLSARELAELRDIRLALEGLAAARAAEAISDEEIARLRRLDAAIAELRGSGDVKRIIREIRSFHFTLYAAARMPALLRLIESQWMRSGPYINRLFPGYTSRDRGTLRARVLAAVAARDPAAAREALVADVKAAADYLVAQAREAEAAA